MAREDVLDVVSDGAESCDNWRKPVSARCADANDCGKGGSITTPTFVVTVTLTAADTVNAVPVTLEHSNSRPQLHVQPCCRARSSYV